MEQLQGQHIRGRPVKINFKTEMRGSRPRPDTRTYDRGWRSKHVPAMNVNERAYAFDRWNRTDAPDHWTGPNEEGRRLYVGGLPRISGQDAVNAEMQHLFNGWHVEAVSKIISPHPSKQSQPGSHYYCFVDLPNAEEAREAAEVLNGKDTSYGGTYKVLLGSRRRPGKVQREQLWGLGEEEKSAPPQRNLDGDWRSSE